MGFGPVRKFGEDEDDAGNPADDVIDCTPVTSESVVTDELKLISDAFTSTLIWAAEAGTLVDMGWHLATMLKVMRPALFEGMMPGVPRELERGLRDALKGTEPELIGAAYWPLLAWCRRCTSLSQMGTRTFAMIYVLRRDLLSGRNTNAAIASLQNKTRQSFNRTVQNFRDTFRGFRNGVMRGEGTRIKCRKAQS